MQSTPPTDGDAGTQEERARDVAFIDAETGKLWVSSVCPQSIDFFVEYGGSRYVNRRMRDMLDASLTRLGKYHCAVSEGLALKVGAEILHNYHRDAEDTPVSGSATPAERVVGNAVDDVQHVQHVQHVEPVENVENVENGRAAQARGAGVVGRASVHFRCRECGVECANQSGLTRHVNAKHASGRQV